MQEQTYGEAICNERGQRPEDAVNDINVKFVVASRAGVVAAYSPLVIHPFLSFISSSLSSELAAREQAYARGVIRNRNETRRRLGSTPTVLQSRSLSVVII